MTEYYRKPCFDSSVFISGIDGEICRGIKRGVIYQHLLEEVRAGTFRILLSAMALAEVYKKKRFTTSSERLIDEFLQLVEGEYVDVIEVDREVGIQANRLCRDHARDKLSPMDAIHLACAISAGCDVLLTWDRPFSAVIHPEIRIEEPRLRGGLFAESMVIATDEETAEYRARLNLEKRTRLGVTYTVILCGGDAAPEPPLIEPTTEDPQLLAPAPLLLSAKEETEIIDKTEINVEDTPKEILEPKAVKESTNETTIEANTDLT